MTSATALTTGGKVAAIIPHSIEEVFRLATAVHKSGLAPAGIKTPEAITIAIMHGMELGLPPMQAIQRIAVINGRPTVWGDAIPALLLSRGFKIRERVSGGVNTRCAECEITRPDGQVFKGVFSVTDATRAGLWGKAGPWKQYPDRMLQMRARGFAARDGAADVLGGLHLAEEVDDQPMRDITPAPAALDLPDIPDAITDDTAEARSAIKQAISIEMLSHVRDAYADADWTALEADYDAKMEELRARAA